MPISGLPGNVAVHTFDVAQVLTFLNDHGAVKLPEDAQIYAIELSGQRLMVTLCPGFGDMPPDSLVPLINHTITKIEDGPLGDIVNLLRDAGIDEKEERRKMREEMDAARAEQEEIATKLAPTATPPSEHLPETAIAERVKSIYDRAHAEVRDALTDYAVIFDREAGTGRVAIPILPLTDTYDAAMDRAARHNMAGWHLSKLECVALSELLKLRLGYGIKAGDRQFQFLSAPILVEPKPQV